MIIYVYIYIHYNQTIRYMIVYIYIHIQNHSTAAGSLAASVFTQEWRFTGCSPASGSEKQSIELGGVKLQAFI